MLRFESVFWATQNKKELCAKLSSLGFKVEPSRRDPRCESVFFGPESIEIFSTSEPLVTLTEQASLLDGVCGIGLDSNHIVEDYERIQKLAAGGLEKPRIAKNTTEDIPLWTGFSIPEKLIPLLRAWVVMNSNAVLHKQGQETLPLTHGNSGFGIEALHVMTPQAQSAAEDWSRLMGTHVSGLKWNETLQSQAHRLQTGDRFFDLVEGKKAGVFMMTLKVGDLESAKALALKAGAAISPCHNRDGFIVDASFTGGVALRFVRSYWKRYLPLLTENFPYGRRTDHFRPLGGANSTTLRAGFTDSW